MEKICISRVISTEAVVVETTMGGEAIYTRIVAVVDGFVSDYWRRVMR